MLFEVRGATLLREGSSRHMKLETRYTSRHMRKASQPLKRTGQQELLQGPGGGLHSEAPQH
jgi:hypothetical protein